MYNNYTNQYSIENFFVPVAFLISALLLKNVFSFQVGELLLANYLKPPYK